MNQPKFKAGDRVRIKPCLETPEEPFLKLLPKDNLVGKVGVIKGTFTYEFRAADYDVALDGVKYRNHHQYSAIDEEYLELVTDE